MEEATSFGTYILDFYCHQRRLSVEIDGPNHFTPEKIKDDQVRTEFVNSMGVKELRFTNEEVRTGLEHVINEIIEIGK